MYITVSNVVPVFKDENCEFYFMKICMTKKNHLFVIVFIGDKLNDSDCVFFKVFHLI